ncbi:MAG: hypothetical protein ABL893_07495, partial [Hyphomicrobium sp.]
MLGDRMLWPLANRPDAIDDDEAGRSGTGLIRDPSRDLFAAIVLASTAALAGCSSAGVDAPALALPKMPDISSVASIGSTANDAPVGSATEIYTRVARGANTCWFGGSGPLKKDYIYHAEADAPSRGGKAEIVVHARDPLQPNPRGAKAFRINIDPVGEAAATLKTENLKMPDPMAAAMTADANRWAKGDQGCEGASTVAGWGAAQPAASAVVAPPPAKAGKAKAPAA